jgi:glycosyltransferase involved in cell wall biosynthesis
MSKVHPGDQVVRVAITYSYSLYWGGAERVLEALAELFPTADFFCLLANPKFVPPALNGRQITTSFLDKIPFSTRYHRAFIALYPMAAESLNLDGYDLVISSDGMATKGVITNELAKHVCYCHSPHRSLWDQYTHYQSTLHGLKKMVFSASAHYVRQWDFGAAQRIDTFIANSHYMASRIRKYYRRDSVVIYPPVSTTRGFISPTTGDYYLTVGRLTAAKRTEIIVEACSALGRRLIVVGTGAELDRLRKIAGPTVEFAGYVEDDRLPALYSQCRAFLFAAQEDFGIAPVEAQSYGRPVIAYAGGGALETIVEARTHISDSTGIFFHEQTTSALVQAIEIFEEVEWEFTPERIREHSLKFDTKVFADRLMETLEIPLPVFPCRSVLV